MSADKSIADMSSDELFELAQSRKEQELNAQRESLRADMDALKEERRQLINTHKKALNTLDGKINTLRKQMNLGGGTGKTRTRTSVNVSSLVLEILADKTQLSTKEIQAELSNNGVTANNLSQTLAYLKRQGKISSPSRSIYAIA